MRPIYLLLAVALLAGCKKKDEYKPTQSTFTAPDFQVIPTHDAVWKVEGIIWNSTDGRHYHHGDTDYSKRVIVIKATGRDTMVGPHRYYYYSFDDKLMNRNTDKVFWEFQHGYYLRGDSSTMTIYGVNEQPFLSFNDPDLYNEKVYFKTWTNGTIRSADSILLAGCYLKRWNIRNAYEYDNKEEYFYKAVGIGTYAGLASPYSFERVTTLTFTYKGEQIRFDNPLE